MRNRFQRTLTLLIVPALALCGCAATVSPPLDPARPVRVFIIDYGRHSSLLLPDGDGERLIEFAYGDWRWFALDRDSPLDVLPTLFLPTQGTLGRQEWRVASNPIAIGRRIPSEIVHAITVSGDDMAALRERLEARYQTHIETRIHSERYMLDFVHDDRDYCLLSSCNPVLIEWLRELNCEVRGYPLIADFRIRGQ